MRTLYNRTERDLSLKGQITFKDGNSMPVEIGDIFNYSVNSQIGSDGLPLGGTESASFSLELDNTGRKYTPETFDSAEVHMFVGIRPHPRNYLWNSEFRMERDSWQDWGSPRVREIVLEDKLQWCHIVGSGNGSDQGVRQAVESAPDEGMVTFSTLARGGMAGQQFTVNVAWTSGTTVTGRDSHTFTVDTDAERVSFTSTVPAGSDSFTIQCGVDSESSASDVYFTELMLYPGTEYAEWLPAPEDFGATVSEDGYAWTSFGVWYVDSASAPEQSVSIQLSGYDALATHFTAKYIDEPSQYPLPLEDFFMTVATAAGVRPADANFTNAKYRIPAMPEWDENTTLRDVLSDIAIAAGGYARMTRDGKLEIASFSNGREYDIDPDAYNTFTLTGGTRYAFNAIEALMDSETEEYTRFAIDGSIPANATNTVQLDYNPTLSADLVNLVTTDLKGIHMDAGTLTSGGDPMVTCGDFYTVTTLKGETYRIMVTSQAFSFDGGLGCTETCSLPSANSVSSASYSTSANAYDKNGNLRASHVAGLDGRVISATEAHFKHLTAESAEIDTLLASFIEALNLVVGRIDADTIDTDSLTAIVANISKAVISEAKIDVAQIENLTATILDAVTATIGTADIDYGHIKDLLADEAIITDGVGRSLLIERLYVTAANLVGATIDNLVLKGEDGNYYEVVITSDGTIHTRQVSVTEGEIEAGETEDGRQIVGTYANFVELNTQKLKAQSAIIGEIFTEALTAGKITASEALIASATIPTLYATTIKAIGDQLDLSANESVRIVVQGEVQNVEERVDQVEQKTTRMESSIETNRQQIELRATKQEVTEAVDGTLGSVRVEYCQSTSPTIAPSGPWSTTAPEWEAGKYMWQRTTSVRMDGQMISSEATCISGARGADGSQGSQGVPGVSVTKITPQYYLSASSSTQSGGSPTTTPPAWQSGRYLWTRSMINYSDGSTGYSAWVLDNTWNDMGRRVAQAESTLTVQAGEIASKVSQGDLRSSIIQNADAIRLKADKIAWQSTNSSMSETGNLECREAKINGNLDNIDGPYWIGINQAHLSGGRIINGKTLEQGSLNFTLATNNSGSILYGMAIISDCIQIECKKLYVSIPGQVLNIGTTGEIYVRTNSGGTTLRFVNGILVGGI